jgi:predicted P-loop ATPase
MTDMIINGGPGNVINFSAVAKAQSSGEADWIALCQRDKNGKPLSNLANAMIALRNDQNLSQSFALDEMLQAPMLMQILPGEPNPQNFKPRPLTDHDVTRCQELLQLAGLKGIGKDVMHQAIDRRAVECKFHPVREFLNNLEWDGTKRIHKWLSTYLGAECSPYTEAVGRMFLISMIARKADYMIVLEGPQGAKKSTACTILGGDWFSDSLPDVTGGKDVSQHLPGKWLIEIAEMSAMTKAETTQLKAFISRTEERYRPSYGRKEVKQPRQCVFIGTTNQSVYLRDETGARRFWPITIGKIDSDALLKDRDQLLAEAVHLYLQGEPWHPTGDFEQKYIRPEQDARFEVDVWEETIRAHLKLFKPKVLLLGDLLYDALGIAKEHRSTRNQRRATAILERLGWKRLKKDGDGNIPWGPPDGFYEDTDDTDDTDDILGV